MPIESSEYACYFRKKNLRVLPFLNACHPRACENPSAADEQRKLRQGKIGIFLTKMPGQFVSVHSWHNIIE